MLRITLLLLTLTTISSKILCQGLGKEDKMISIFFGGGSYWIDEEEELKLNEFIFSIDNLHEYDIEIHGHTDNIGSREYNLFLSENRSQSVLYQLNQLEINLDAVRIYDFGEDSPVYDNETWRGRLSNRRVDVILRKILM